MPRRCHSRCRLRTKNQRRVIRDVVIKAVFVAEVYLGAVEIRVFVGKDFAGTGRPFVFPSQNPKRPLSDMTLLKILRDRDAGVTVHGFRSSFRDWVAEQTSYPGEVAEAALAHAIPNRVEAAYRRTDFLEKHKSLIH